MEAFKGPQSHSLFPELKGTVDTITGDISMKILMGIGWELKITIEKVIINLVHWQFNSIVNEYLLRVVKKTYVAF